MFNDLLYLDLRPLWIDYETADLFSKERYLERILQLDKVFNELLNSDLRLLGKITKRC